MTKISAFLPEQTSFPDPKPLLQAYDPNGATPKLKDIRIDPDALASYIDATYAIHVYMDGDQLLPPVINPFPFDTVDTSRFPAAPNHFSFDAPNSEITVLKTGIYAVNWLISAINFDTNLRPSCSFYRNAVLTLRGETDAQHGVGDYAEGNFDILSLTANDVLHLQCNGLGATSETFIGLSDSCFWQMALLQEV